MLAGAEDCEYERPDGHVVLVEQDGLHVLRGELLRQEVLLHEDQEGRDQGLEAAGRLLEVEGLQVQNLAPALVFSHDLVELLFQRLHALLNQVALQQSRKLLQV